MLVYRRVIGGSIDRLQVEGGGDAMGAENVVVERVPHGCSGVHLISCEPLSLTMQPGQGVM